MIILRVGDAQNSPYQLHCKCKLVYFDPPYSMDNVARTNAIYDAHRYLSPDSWFVVFTNFKVRYLFEHTLHNFHDITLINEIIWAYEFGLYTKNRFVPSHDAILIYKKGTPDFNWTEVAIESQRNRSGDPRADIRGRTPGDIWNIPRVPGNSNDLYYPLDDEMRSSHPRQLVMRLLLALTNKADWIYDPFMGSGTVAKCCYMLGRCYAGLDIKSTYVKEVKMWFDERKAEIDYNDNQ